MLRELLAQANELRAQAQKVGGEAGRPTMPRQDKVAMMNHLEQVRRENLMASKQRMERMMAANQASMQVAQQQQQTKQPGYMLPTDPNQGSAKGGGLLAAPPQSQETQQPQGGSNQGGWQPYWYR